MEEPESTGASSYTNAAGRKLPAFNFLRFALALDSTWFLARRRMMNLSVAGDFRGKVRLLCLCSSFDSYILNVYNTQSSVLDISAKNL